MRRVEGALLSLAAILALRACTPPEQQVPVELEPGAYLFTYAHTLRDVEGEAAEPERHADRREACFSSEDLAEALKNPLPIALNSSPECTGQTFNRQGNAFGGTFRCSMREYGPTLHWNVTHAGKLSDSHFELEGQVSATSPGSGAVVKEGEMKIRAQYQGFCGKIG